MAKIYKTRLRYAKVENYNLEYPTPMNHSRAHFFRNLETQNFNECIDKYIEPVNKTKVDFGIG